MANSRVQRGRESEKIVAEFFRQHGFPYAERVAASLKGADITGTPGLAVEVKSRYGLDLNAWMKQAKGRDGLPVLVIRMNWTGPATVASWPAVVPLAVLAALLRQAGYGEQEACDQCP
jgi:hypothetical protein